MSGTEAAKHTVINEILPKAGLVYSEKGNLSEVLCKPKVMALKSATLQQVEALEKTHDAGASKDKEAVGQGAAGAGQGGGGSSGGGQTQSQNQKSAEVMSFD